jgi:hypothetical protein
LRRRKVDLVDPFSILLCQHDRFGPSRNNGKGTNGRAHRHAISHTRRAFSICFAQVCKFEIVLMITLDRVAGVNLNCHWCCIIRG